MSVTGWDWPAVLGALLRHEDLDADATRWAMGQIFAGDATPAQIAAFAVALRSKGETAAEMSGLAAAMLDAAHRIDVPAPAIDIVGTGGDRSHSVNISTMAALVVAGAGERVVKHGNRAASSACGTADVLEELGVVLTLPPEQVAEVARDAGITFCFAQVFHPSFRHAAGPRKEIGVPTSFNFLGPLTNPAQPIAQAIGCADARMAPVMAQVFAERGSAAMVFRGDDGLDELTVSTTSSVWRVHHGRVAPGSIDPERLGIAAAPLEALRGGSPSHNAGVVRAVLAGDDQGPIRDAVLLNAAAALVSLDDAAGRGANDLHEALESGLRRAAASVDSGSAADALARWVGQTQRRAT
jgi:anthranilate phosphoribosyltransferase